jgi:predicted nucleic acid-binding protein
MAKIVNAAGVRLSAPEWISDAIAEYSNQKISFGDACIAAEARKNRLVVASFDRDFDSLQGSRVLNPTESI